MKLFIQNRKGLKLAVTVEENSKPTGLAFIMHGLGGWKDQKHIQTFAQAFRDAGFTVVLFDTTHSFGESEGDYADATTTKYYQDLEDVIEWSQTQNWYQEPFWLAGHSLGGISTALYAEKYPDKVKALAPISTVVSGNLSIQTEQYNKDVLEAWKKTGWYEKESASRPGFIKRIKWAELEDRLKHDLIPEANKLTMPVLMIVGSEDLGTPPEHQKIFFDAIPGKKELHVIPGAPHTFTVQNHLDQIKSLFDNWIHKNL